MTDKLKSKFQVLKSELEMQDDDSTKTTPEFFWGKIIIFTIILVYFLI